MNSKEKILLGSACFLGGVIVGFLVSPIKKGICCAKFIGEEIEKNLNDLEDEKSEEKKEEKAEEKEENKEAEKTEDNIEE